MKTLIISKEDISYDNAREFIGGYVERYKVKNTVFLMDEDGTPKDLPINLVATPIFQDVIGPNSPVCKLRGNIIVLIDGDLDQAPDTLTLLYGSDEEIEGIT